MEQKEPILTKKIVFKRLLRLPFILSICFGILMMSVALLSEESALDGILLGFMMGVIAFIVFSLQAIPHMLRLNRQEKVMGFDFNEEMKKRKIRKDRINAHWYIDRGIVIRKGYIRRIEKVKYVNSMYSKTSQKTEARITFRTIDNQLGTITMSRGVSPKFENWVKK